MAVIVSVSELPELRLATPATVNCWFWPAFNAPRTQETLELEMVLHPGAVVIEKLEFVPVNAIRTLAAPEARLFAGVKPLLVT